MRGAGCRRLAGLALGLFGSVLTAAACAADDAAPADTPAVETTAPTTTPAEADSTIVPAASARRAAGAPASSGVRSGAEVAAADGFSVLSGLRVGLIANQSALVDGDHLADLLQAAPDVDLVALFAPEHGFRGDLNGGVLFDDGVDAATGLPLFSLYGENRQPTPDMLDGVDVLVFDIQDVGARFYTFISTMGLAMQSAAEADIPFVVFDRPNPVGGRYVGGFLRTPDQESFIGQFPIPAAYGLTIGELARAIVAEEWVPGVGDLELEVVPLAGWQRDMTWLDTGLAWRPPSAGLQQAEAAIAYPGTVLFEATSLSYGIGTREPFLLFGAPWANGHLIADSLNAEPVLPGVRFEPVAFVPVPIEGWTSSPRLEGESLVGVRLVIDDPGTFLPVETGVYLLAAFIEQGLARDVPLDELIDRPSTMDLLAGSTRMREAFEAGRTAAEIIAGWATDRERFEPIRRAAMIYP